MPIIHRFFPENSVIVSKHIGVVNDQEFLASYRRLFGGDEFDPSYDLVVDLRGTESTGRSADALREIAAIVEQKYADTHTSPRTAVIAPKNLSFGMGRMYQSFAMLLPGEVAVFRAAEPALEWLQVPGEILSTGPGQCPPVSHLSSERDTP